MLKTISRSLTRSRNQKGFTLVELMVVVIILGILAALVLPNFIGLTDKAKKGRAIAEMRNVQNALVMYYNEKNDFPAIPIGNSLAPFGISSLGNDPWDNPYTYERQGAGDGLRARYILTSGGPDGAETTGDNIIATHKQLPQ